ncbi:TetR/AcrR family transcriptional regulator [Halorarum halophilum]|uniref:TetR/AcrR family transcriptional regulator n=1 Tax=Halorarum halophilum TaxID=2743090 RepID=A0A7D5GWC4_9EURY|nr:TetR/AcrR family transcriptional regulator [Halobaculum halophilum]QLG26789.1 TetR/AcrR family transcriptional regulator [Halobaculum halophilum]
MNQENQEHDTETAFMEATYRALCEHGYADLTMQDIADETDKSKAALHYHFEGKEDLLLRFLEYLRDDFAERTADPAGDTSAERLVALVRTVLGTSEDGPDQQFNTAYMEIKAQAPFRDGYREVLREMDEGLRCEVHDLVAAGVEAGEFRADTDPDEVAGLVVTYIHGTWTRSAAVGEDVPAMRERLVNYITDLLVDGADATFDADPEVPE